jgi:hypothetical protein
MLVHSGYPNYKSIIILLHRGDYASKLINKHTLDIYLASHMLDSQLSRGFNFYIYILPDKGEEFNEFN